RPHDLDRTAIPPRDEGPHSFPRGVPPPTMTTGKSARVIRPTATGGGTVDKSTSMPASLDRYMTAQSALVDTELKSLLRGRPEEPETIVKAMSYSIFAGGKRLRPVLVMAAAECCGLPGRKTVKT